MASRKDLINNALDIFQTRSCRLESGFDGISFGPPHRRVLASGFDFINHGASVSWEAGANVTLAMKGGELVVRATRRSPYYGDSTRPAWKCLLNYGFGPHFSRIPIPGDPPADERDDANLAESTWMENNIMLGHHPFPAKW
jgi:hypothetical protein